MTASGASDSSKLGNQDSGSGQVQPSTGAGLPLSFHSRVLRTAFDSLPIGPLDRTAVPTESEPGLSEQEPRPFFMRMKKAALHITGPIGCTWLASLGANLSDSRQSPPVQYAGFLRSSHT